MKETLLVTLGLTSILAIAAGQDTSKAVPQFDPKIAFQRLDVNKDGKLSRKEFDLFMPKQTAVVKDKIFKSLDSDGDGFLTLGEFARILDLIAANQKKTPPKAGDAARFNDTPTADQLSFFEKKIRPVLVNQCYQCHSAQTEKIKGKLVLDTREGIRKGGASGPAIVPGNPRDSLLVQAISHSDESLKMPKDKLSDAVIADFVQWVKIGAPDPRDGPAFKVAAPAIDIKKGKEFWAFQRPRRSAPPKQPKGSWSKSPIDEFLLAAMRTKGVEPVADAERSTLLRRVYLDLIGLPPTPEDITAFLADAAPNAFEKVVDRLLASAPQFGERWGRHWLDVARYGETSGKQVNMNFPSAWRYRDYVITAFNADKPYNQFIREQIAGDLLPFNDEKQHAAQLVATGFLALGPKDLNERNRLLFTMDVVDEQIDTVTQAFLGLTVSCARCHDHRFDPIPQQDYYALAGIFKSTQALYGTIKLIQNQHPTALVPLAPEAGQVAGVEPLGAMDKKKLDAEHDGLVKERDRLRKEGKFVPNMEVIFNGIRLAQIESKIASYDADGKPKLLAMAVRDATFADDCPLFIRGEVAKPGAKVQRGFPQVLTDRQPKIARGSGRLELANWLASRTNPLTARVLVNRVWLHLFGRGLVATPDNFGAAGQPPSHPELLDYLAVTFMEDDGWSIKKLIRRIVLSRAYQLSSQPNTRNIEIDPDNVLVWRMSKQRLDAEALRDSILAVSGRLAPKPFEGSVVARIGDGYSNPVARFVADAKFPFRSVYLPVVRGQTLETLTLFDFPDPSLVAGQRATTTVPAQALYFLNNPWLIGQADALADRVLAKNATDSARVKDAYLRCFARAPTAAEVESAETFVKQHAAVAAGKATPAPQHMRQAWSAFCQALYGSAEFVYRN